MCRLNVPARCTTRTCWCNSDSFVYVNAHKLAIGHVCMKGAGAWLRRRDDLKPAGTPVEQLATQQLPCSHVLEVYHDSWCGAWGHASCVHESNILCGDVLVLGCAAAWTTPRCGCCGDARYGHDMDLRSSCARCEGIEACGEQKDRNECQPHVVDTGLRALCAAIFTSRDAQRQCAVVP